MDRFGGVLYILCYGGLAEHWGPLPATRLASRKIHIEQNIKKWTGPALCVLWGLICRYLLVPFTGRDQVVERLGDGDGTGQVMERLGDGDGRGQVVARLGDGGGRGQVVERLGDGGDRGQPKVSLFRE